MSTRALNYRNAVSARAGQALRIQTTLRPDGALAQGLTCGTLHDATLSQLTHGRCLHTDLRSHLVQRKPRPAGPCDDWPNCKALLVATGYPALRATPRRGLRWNLGSTLSTHGKSRNFSVALDSKSLLAGLSDDSCSS